MSTTLRIPKLVLMIFSILLTAVPAHGQLFARGKITKDTANAKMLTISLMAYAVDYDGKFPKTLEELEKGGYMEKGSIEKSKPFVGEKWLYFPAKSMDAPRSIVISWDSARDGKRLVAWSDGAAEQISEEDYKAQIEKQNKRAAEE